MKRLIFATASIAVAFALAAPLAAQQSTVQPAPQLPPTRELPADRGYDKETPRTAAVNAVEAPVTAELNKEIQTVTDTRDVVRSAGAQAQYDADMAAYRSQVEANDVAVRRDDRRYANQQRAYADAMTAWRIQADDCKRGVRAACQAPTPSPTSFY